VSTRTVSPRTDGAGTVSARTGGTGAGGTGAGSQPSLFGGLLAGPAGLATIRFDGTFEGWQAAARAALHRSCPPATIWWHSDAQAERPAASDSPALRVPRAYLQAARAAACHRAPDRWALLYRLLWRLAHGEPALLEDTGDADVERLGRYRKAVARDVHKMKAFVRFRELAEPGQDQPRYVAWFEPSQLIVEYASGFFRRRFSNMRWSILTPDRCAHWEGDGAVWFSTGVSRDAAPDSDRFEAAWARYYASIFNPARLKLTAMRSEMPQKYWKNLPEAALIGRLAQQADTRVAAMTRKPQADQALRCGPRPAAAPTDAGAVPSRLQDIARGLQSCTRCPWACHGTQAVAGEGPMRTPVMLVGEQPGDREDLAGRPFVGPAGDLLNQALRAAGLRREQLFLTNAVKHFKFRPQGRRRLHQTPDARDLFECSDWLAAEIEAVAPALVICLGATAARAVLGTPVRVQRDRGKLIQAGARQVLVTVHPAHLLRQQGPAVSRGIVTASQPFADFARDLAQAAPFIAAGSASRGSP
jgi:DNA polymerase